MPYLARHRQENKRMRKFFEIGLNSYGLHLETTILDIYITPTGLVLGVAVIVALRIRKVLKTRKAGKK
jgi:hypothetical protein